MYKFLIFLLFPILATAETNYVWMPIAGGIGERDCRVLWEEYDSAYGTNTVIITKPGANGLIAINDMIQSAHDNKMMCSGSTIVVYNQIVDPTVNYRTEELETIIKFYETSSFWFVPNSNPAKNFNELIISLRSLNRPVNVGFTLSAHEVIAKYLAKKYNISINIIKFKSSSQIFPSLIDGSLDLAFENGLGVALAQDRKLFRLVGYSSEYKDSTVSGIENFGDSDSNLKKITSWQSISMPKNSNQEFKNTVTNRLKSLLTDGKFQTTPIGHRIISTNGKELEEKIIHQKILINTIYQ
jgi:tripartite-type tricarboxylate transporter receptor subunit TctC